MLPCPLCAASLKAENLERHLLKTHSGQRAEARAWAGRDRAIIRPLALLFVFMCLSIPLLPLAPQGLSDALLVVIALQASVFLLGLTLTLAHKLPATLSLEGDRLVLRYCFGLLRRTATLPPAGVEVGTLLEARRTVHIPIEYETAHDDVSIGTFMRLRSEAGVLVLASRKGTAIRKHWQGFTAGAAARVWDITIERSAMVAIEYLLAQRGALAPRAKPAERA